MNINAFSMLWIAWTLSYKAIKSDICIQNMYKYYIVITVVRTAFYVFLEEIHQDKKKVK